MFLGHFALGLAAKRVAPAVSLGTPFLAAQFADLLWPNLLLLGVERVAIRPGVKAVAPLNFISYRPRDAVGKWGFAGVILLLVAIQFGAVSGPPPTPIAAVAWSAQALWLLVLLGYWVDRHRYATVALPRASA